VHRPSVVWKLSGERRSPPFEPRILLLPACLNAPPIPRSGPSSARSRTG
jgi:hypothetical protein